MSLIIAIKDKNRVILGSDKQSSTTYNCEHTATKIWEIEEIPGAVMGGVGSCRCNQIIQFNQLLDKNDIDYNKIDTHYVVNHIVPSIVGILKTFGVNTDTKDHEDIPMIPNTFLFAYEDKAWMILNDLSVSEINEYLAIGSGSDVAMGALYATKDKDPFDRIVTCIDAAAESTLFVDNGVDLLATDYFDEDIPLINKVFGYEAVEDPKKVEKKKTTKKTDTKKKKTTTKTKSTKEEKVEEVKEDK